MLHFRMDMPLYLMMLYGSVLLLAVLLLRALFKNRLPKFVFPVLWMLVLARFLVPYALSSPLSIKQVPELSRPLPAAFTEDTAVLLEGIPEEAVQDVQIQEEAMTEITNVPGMASNPATSYTADSFYYVYGRWPLIHNISVVIYILGVIITLSVLLYQKRCYAGKLKNSLLVERNETINTILREMNMGHILVFTNDEIASPLVSGLLAPRIYLPARMDFGNTELLRHILMHETMHIRRRDNWIRLLMLIALCINWFNPLVWIMSKCLSSDLELACDEAVLLQCGEENRQSYAFSLLAMAITASRPTLLYSAFCKTEVEKRVSSIIRYKKASMSALLFALLLIGCSTVAFATGGQAPFSSYLSAYCTSDSCRWGAKAYITRDIQLGENADRRADDVILEVLRTNTDNDPVTIEAAIKKALAAEFHVEPEAFRIDISLCLPEEALYAEYAQWKLLLNANGYLICDGEPVRYFFDEAAGRYQAAEGVIDVFVQRDRFGRITAITTQHPGDAEFDRRNPNSRTYHSYYSEAESSQVQENTVTEYTVTESPQKRLW